MINCCYNTNEGIEDSNDGGQNMKILKNNLYILKLCFKAAPLCVCLKVFADILNYVTDTLIALFFMRYIVEAVQGNKSYKEAFILILGMFVVKVAASIMDRLGYHVLERMASIKTSALLMEML